jgi:hypothetical protein
MLLMTRRERTVPYVVGRKETKNARPTKKAECLGLFDGAFINSTMLALLASPHEFNNWSVESSLASDDRSSRIVRLSLGSSTSS